MDGLGLKTILSCMAAAFWEQNISFFTETVRSHQDRIVILAADPICDHFRFLFYFFLSLLIPADLSVRTCRQARDGRICCQ